MSDVTIQLGDARTLGLPDASVDAIVCDPPYELGFMGKRWDASGVAYDPATWREAYRVLKPGGHLLAFGGTRTSHRMACAIEDAGFEIRDTITWLYGSGFPKSLDVSKAIDKAAGAEREVIGSKLTGTMAGQSGALNAANGWRGGQETVPVTTPATAPARQWQGWGTALKPASEPITVARKPFKGTVADNVQAHGTGAINIDATRVASVGRPAREVAAMREDVQYRGTSLQGRVDGSLQSSRAIGTTDLGRWPANVVLSHVMAWDGADACAGTGCLPGCPVAALDEQAGRLTSGAPGIMRGGNDGPAYGAESRPPGTRMGGYGDTGGASRFFPTFRYQAKAPTRERPSYWTSACECEDSWPITSRAKAIGATGVLADSNTSKSGSGITDEKCPTPTTSTTSTATRPTTIPPTSERSPGSNTSASTRVVISGAASGGSPAPCAVSSSRSAVITGTSPLRDGPCTDGAGPATSPAWSETSECGSCGRPARREAHATVKPLALMQWLVRLVTPPGGTVLDPFAGSGTTVEAAILEGFNVIAVESHEPYLALIRARVERCTEGKRLV